MKQPEENSDFTKPIKVLYLITDLNIGGTERVLERLVKNVNRAKFLPVVACLDGCGYPFQNIKKAAISVISIGIKNKRDAFRFLKLVRQIKRFAPHILHAMLFHANLLGRLAGRLAGVPIVVTSERTMAMESKARYLLNRLTTPLVDKVVAVSEAVAEFCRAEIGIPVAKVKTIYNGIELRSIPSSAERLHVRRLLGIEQDRYVVGTVSRLDRVKGIEYLLDAMDIVSRSTAVPPCVLIVGDGPERSKLEKKMSTGRVLFVGEQKEVSDFIVAMDIFVLPSLHEGFPNALLEAMAAARPVVASAVGGVPETVEDRISGLLVPPADSVKLAKAIQHLLENPEVAVQMGRMGRARVEQCFTIHRMVRETEELYEELIAEKLRLRFTGSNGWQPILAPDDQ